MLGALCCNLHTLVPDSCMKFKWWKKKKINTLIICGSDKWMSQQNFTAEKVIYLSEILCVYMERSDFFSSLPLLWNCSCFLANLLRRLFSLRCWQGQEKDVAWGNHTSSIKSWLESQAAHSLWFLKVCQKSCIIWKWRRDFWTKINSWIFWTAHVQSSNENVLEGSVNSGLWDQLHHRSDNTTEHLKFSKNPRLEKFGSNAADVNASEGSEK